MAIAKVILNGVTQMDVTQKTVTAGSMLSGTTALKNDGTDITGSIASKSSSDLTASGATVTAPAGYYAAAASKSVASGTAGTPTATKGTATNHSVSVTPSVTNTTGYITGGTKTGTAVTVSASELVSGTKTISASGTTDVTNYESVSVASGSATTPATTITANPSISVDASGLITATVSKTQSVTPSVSAGYVSSGTAGTITVSGSGTSQLTTQAAQTIHPSTTDQTIASGKYLTGTQTIKAVTVTNLTAANIVSGVTVKVGDSTDDDCVASVTGTAETGGGGGPTLLHSENVEISYSSTSKGSVATLDVGTEVFGNHIVYIKVRDTMGRRQGYFYGSDTYIYNMGAINNLASATQAAQRIYVGWRGSSSTLLTGTSMTSRDTYYGIYGWNVTDEGIVTLYAVYQSSYTGTINSTYKVDVYLLPYPGGTFE